MKKKVRALLFLVAAVCLLPSVCLHANEPVRSVLVLLDATYSMSFVPEDASDSYYSQALDAVAGLAEGRGESTELAFGYFEDVGHLEVVVPFGETASAVTRHHFPERPWGTTELHGTLEKATTYVSEYGSAEDKVVLLLTDGVVTEGSPPPVHTLADSGVRIAVYLYHSILGSGGQEALRGLARATGGRVLPAGADPGTTLDPPAPAMQTSPTRYAVPRRIAKPLAGEAAVHAASTLPEQPRLVFWLFLALLVMSSMAVLFTMAAPRRTRTPPPEPFQVAHLELRSPGGPSEEIRLSPLPATIGYGKDVQFRLEGKGPSKTGCFSILVENDIPFLKTAAPMIIGGVKRSEKPLKTNDILKFGAYRFRFLGVEQVAPEAPEARRRPSAGHAFASIALCFMFLFLTITQAPTSSRVDMPSPDKPRSGTERTPRAFQKYQEDADLLRIERRELVMVPPHAPLPPLDADALFIHAHPDDEAIDYGGLMARLSASGLEIVTVLLTDGESGLDQYPRRAVSAEYPAHDLKGSALSAVRVQETCAALSALGATHYVRLGLPNKPYHSVLMEEQVEDVLGRWGGEDQLVTELAAIIQHYRPEILVSPDEASEASEHFEHEATGYLVARTLERYGPFDTVRVHLTSVDPLQRHVYPNALAVPLVGEVRGTPWDSRIPQARALKAHRTQRDSAVIGLEIRMLQRYEYYVPRFWAGSDSVMDYLLRHHRPAG